MARRSSASAGGGAASRFAARRCRSARGPRNVSTGRRQSISSSTTRRRSQRAWSRDEATAPDAASCSAIASEVHASTDAAITSRGAGTEPTERMATVSPAGSSGDASAASWTASSRVGAMSSSFERGEMWRSAGSRNASDFPEPVSACSSSDSPASTRARAAAWMGVGVSIPRAESDSAAAAGSDGSRARKPPPPSGAPAAVAPAEQRLPPAATEGRAVRCGARWATQASPNARRATIATKTTALSGRCPARCRSACERC
mmetsp:Transcript_25923/g.83234  ORF Transcript_25923/g.83234 Transcript_25923/m.83234 type:complete len:260 (+) Transcript_25923:2063-2842(+)